MTGTIDHRFKRISVAATEIPKSYGYITITTISFGICRKINENELSATSSADGFFTRMRTNTANAVRNQHLKKLLPQKQAIHERLAAFHSAHPETTRSSDSEIGSISAAIWSDSNPDLLLKTLFCLSVVLDPEYTYEYADHGLTALSMALWNAPDAMKKIKAEYRSIYLDIAKKPFSATQKWMLGGVAALVLLTPVLAPVALGGASATAITGGLASLGGSMVGGIGAFAVAEMALDGLTIAATYGLLDASNKAQVRGEFRKMDLDATADMLAIKAYSLSVAKRLDVADTFKGRIDSILGMIQDLKGDTDYALYVEKENVAENKQKIQLFHRFDTKLAEIVGV